MAPFCAPVKNIGNDLDIKDVRTVASSSSGKFIKTRSFDCGRVDAFATIRRCLYAIYSLVASESCCTGRQHTTVGVRNSRSRKQSWLYFACLDSTAACS